MLKVLFFAKAFNPCQSEDHFQGNEIYAFKFHVYHQKNMLQNVFMIFMSEVFIILFIHNMLAKDEVHYMLTAFKWKQSLLLKVNWPNGIF